MAVEVGEAYVSIIPSARGFGKKLNDEIGGDVDSAGRDAGDRAGHSFAGAYVKHFGLIAAAAAGIGAFAVGKFIASTIQSASDLNETISKSNTIFGENAKEIEDWAGTAATSMGQSKQQALGAAAQFGNMFKQLGIGGQTATTMSKQMVELAGDFASFHNVDITEVLEAQSAAFRGEYDAVQRFVPTITAATVEQKAMALGLAASTKELDAQDKAIATQALLLEGAGEAVGDFARTSQGLANQQRIMSAQWENLKAVIGEAFIPVAAQAAQLLTSKVIPAIQDFAAEAGPKIAAKLSSFIKLLSEELPDAIDEFKKAFKTGFTEGDATVIEKIALKFRDLKDDIKDVIQFVKDNRDWIEPMIAGLTGLAGALVLAATAAKGISLLGGALSVLGAVLPLILTPVGLVALAIGLLAGAAVLAYQKIPLFKEAVDSVAKAFKEGGFKAAVDEAGVQFGKLWDVVKPKIVEFIQKAKDWVVEHGPDILRGLRDAWVGFATWMATEVWPLILTELGKLLKSFGEWATGTALPWIKDKLIEWGKAFGNWVNETAIPWLAENLPKILAEIFRWVRDEALPAIKDKLKEWGEEFGKWVDEEAVPWLEKNLPKILKAIQDWMTGTVLPALATFAKEMATEIGKFALETAKQLPAALVQVNLQILTWAAQLMIAIPGWVLGIGVAIVKGIVSGIAAGAGMLWDSTEQIRETIVGSAADAWNWLYETGRNIITGLINGVESAVEAVVGWFQRLPMRIVNAVKEGLGIGSPSTVFADIGRDIIQGLIDGLTGAIGAVMDFFTSLGGNVIGWVGDAFSWLIGKGGDTIRGMVSGIQSAVGAVSGFFTSLGGQVIGWVGDAFSWLVGKGGDVIRGFISGVTSWIGSIAGHISGIGGTVRSAIGDTASWLYAKGQELIRGFISGIESMAGRAESAAARIVSAAASSIPVAGQIVGLVQALAAGGIVTKPTFALIGEAGPEAVIPLSEFNKGVQFGRYPQFNATMPDGSGTGGGVVNVYPGPFTSPAQVAADLAAEQRWQRLTAGV